MHVGLLHKKQRKGICCSPSSIFLISVHMSKSHNKFDWYVTGMCIFSWLSLIQCLHALWCCCCMLCVCFVLRVIYHFTNEYKLTNIIVELKRQVHAIIKNSQYSVKIIGNGRKIQKTTSMSALDLRDKNDSKKNTTPVKVIVMFNIQI